MKTVAIIPYVRKEAVVEIIPELLQWLKERKIAIKLPIDDATHLGIAKYGFAPPQLFQDVDLVIALGGDGTALRALRLLQKNTLPFFGVNLGRMGFLMRFPIEELYSALTQVLEGKFQIEERSMLSAKFTFLEGTGEQLALNDILVGRQEFNRLIKLDVFINDQFFHRYAADGLIVATPTGSTAYSLSAGGPFVSPETDLLLLTPVCPHSLFNRSLILSGSDKIIITTDERKRKASMIRVSLDGATLAPPVKKIAITLAKEKFKFVVLEKKDFFTSLRQKLQSWDWGAVAEENNSSRDEG